MSALTLVHAEKHRYTEGEERPLGSFLAFMGLYGGLAAGLGGAVLRRGGPVSVSASDLALLTVATHKLSRVLAKDPVTSPLRAPFTTFDGTSGEAELSEQVRSAGPRKAIGELVTCPFCLAQWVGTGLLAGALLAPSPTRMLTTLMTVVTGADVLQYAYAALQKTE